MQKRLRSAPADGAAPGGNLRLTCRTGCGRLWRYAPDRISRAPKSLLRSKTAGKIQRAVKTCFAAFTIPLALIPAAEQRCFAAGEAGKTRGDKPGQACINRIKRAEARPVFFGAVKSVCFSQPQSLYVPDQTAVLCPDKETERRSGRAFPGSGTDSARFFRLSYCRAFPAEKASPTFSPSFR